MKTKRKKQKRKKKLLNLRTKRKTRLISAVTITDYLSTGSPTVPLINTNSAAETLRQAYPIAVYWDNDEDSFMVELSAFNVEFHASNNWSTAVAAASEVQEALINLYRQLGRTLPDVG
jgi:predicted RNase H-like HicB family nuclease